MSGSLAITHVLGAETGPTVAISKLDTNYNVIRDYVNDREITSGLLSARPAAATAGKWYFATDTAQLFFDTGSAWTTVATPSPALNHAFNSSMEIWGAGAAAAPTGWTLSGAGATVAKNTTAGQFKLGAASAALTRVGTDCMLYQDIDTIADYGPVDRWQGRTVSFGCWVRATVASRAKISIEDGVGSTASSFHSGGSTYEFLTVTRTIDAAATRVRIRLEVVTGNTVAQFDGAVMDEASAIYRWIASSWRGRKAILAAGCSTTQAAGLTRYYMQGGPNATEADVLAVLPFAKYVVRRLTVHVNGAPGGAETVVVTLRKNSVDTAVTATVTGAGTSAVDSTNELYFDGGTIDFKAVTSGGAATLSVKITAEVEEVPIA
jgi:hypothetical protein